MNNLRRRLERLEEKLGVNLPPYILVINGPPDGEETPYAKRLSRRCWAYKWGGAFTTEELEKLREKISETSDEPEF
jgi:type VI protein secretion system component VasK